MKKSCQRSAVSFQPGTSRPKTRRWHRVVIAFGSNIGGREKNIRTSLRHLADDPHLRLLKVSSLYLTSPVGPAQREFVNAAAGFLTDYDPPALLRVLKALERRMGRPAGHRRWGPRTIDLDILYYGRGIFRTRALTIPHPRLHERLFVLVPLDEIYPRLVHPALRRTTQSLRRQALLTWPEQKVTISQKL